MTQEERESRMRECRAIINALTASIAPPNEIWQLLHGHLMWVGGILETLYDTAQAIEPTTKEKEERAEDPDSYSHQVIDLVYKLLTSLPRTKS